MVTSLPRPPHAGEESAPAYGYLLDNARAEAGERFVWLAELADDADIDAHLAAIQAGELDLTLAPLISAWGRRPAEHPPAAAVGTSPVVEPS